MAKPLKFGVEELNPCSQIQGFGFKRYRKKGANFEI